MKKIAQELLAVAKEIVSAKKHEPIPKDFPVQPLRPGDKAKDKATCGYCGLSWDDAIGTSYTPAPSARCPFEHFHIYPEPKSKHASKSIVAKPKDPPDLTEKIIAYEQDELDEEATAELFQHLIDTGLVWQLQGSYGRKAMELIRSGQCHR